MNAPAAYREIERRDHRVVETGRAMESGPTTGVLATWAGLASSGAMVLVAILSPALQDYPAYVSQWQAMLEGAPPWSLRGNSYGPLHAALAVVAAIHPHLPRVLFALGLAGATLWLWRVAARKLVPGSRARRLLWAALFANPLFIVFAGGCGNNDTLMAVLVAAGLALYARRCDVSSALLFAAAIAVKLIPVCILPFLIFSRRGIRWRFAVTVAIATLAIFAACYLVWGADVFAPFIKAAARPSKGVSVFKFVRSDYSPLHLVMSAPNFDSLSVYACLLSLGLLFAFHLRTGLDETTSAVIAVGALLTFYKVGHYQFYLTFELMFLTWLVLRRRLVISRCELAPVVVFIAWMAVLSLSYVAFHGHFGHGTEWVRELLAAPHFALSLWMLACLVRYARREAMQQAAAGAAK